jgi:bifunctional non-homologous end joining protein LigD
MRLTRIAKAFDNPDYIFELKHDGFRALAYLQNGECKLISRNLKNLRFESLKLALPKLAVKNAIIDGEICCLDYRGVSQFNQLLNRKAEPVLYAFDLIWLDGEDLRRLPLAERKNRLAALVQASRCERILYAQHVEGEGKRMFEEICARDLEGIVAKRRLGIYKDDGNAWLCLANCYEGRYYRQIAPRKADASPFLNGLGDSETIGAAKRIATKSAHTA